MESRTETPAPAMPTGPSIPINHYLAAAGDKELKRLLRTRASATSRVLRAIEEETAAWNAITAYVAEKYPIGQPAAPAQPDGAE